MNGPELKGQIGELRLTVEVKRAATGLTEKVELIGMIDGEKLNELQAAGLLTKTEGVNYE